MNYAGGETARQGDRVLIEQGRTPGRVTDVIETSREMREYSVDEPGLMIEAAPFGLVFWPSSSLDPAVLVGRAQAQQWAQAVQLKR